jgi:hypothetical protein
MSTGITDMLETDAFSGQMLDAGYLMLDLQKCTNSEFKKMRYPGSVNTGHGFRRNGLYWA